MLRCAEGDTVEWVGEWRRGRRVGGGVVRMRGGDIMLSDGWTEGAMGRVHSTGSGGGGGGGGSHPPEWLHIQRTLRSVDLERVCCCLNEVMRAWGRACAAADRLGACELACSEVLHPLIDYTPYRRASPPLPLHPPHALLQPITTITQASP